MPHRRTIEAQLNVAVPLDVADALDVFCEKRKVKKKAIVELALRRIMAGGGDAAKDSDK